MILPKTGDNYLKCILLCFCAENQVQPCNMFAQNTCPIFLTKFYGNFKFMVIVWILVKNSGVHLDCLWQKHKQKHGDKNYQCLLNDARYIFYNVFPVSSRKNIFSVWEKEKVQFCMQTCHKHSSQDQPPSIDLLYESGSYQYHEYVVHLGEKCKCLCILTGRDVDASCGHLSYCFFSQGIHCFLIMH